MRREIEKPTPVRASCAGLIQLSFRRVHLGKANNKAAQIRQIDAVR